MRRNVVCFLRLIVLGVAVFVMAACHHIALHDPLTGVYLSIKTKVGPSVELDEEVLELCPKRSKDLIAGSLPDVYYVMLYDVTTHELIATDFVDSEGGFIDAPNGTYDVLVYGLNAESVSIKNAEVRSQARAETAYYGEMLQFSKSGEEGEPDVHIQYPIMYEPEHVYVAMTENLRVFPQSDERGITVVRLEATTLCDSYTVQAINVQGAERVSRVSCYVSGQIAYRYLWERRYPDELCAIPIQVSLDVENGTITGCFNSFGKHPQAFSSIFLNIAVVNDAGGLYQWIYDVTDQFNNPDNNDHHIVLSDPIIIPESEAGGFLPSVSEWNADVIHVPL